MKVTLATGDELWFSEDEPHATGPSRLLLRVIAGSLVKLYDTEAGSPQIRVLNWFVDNAGGTLSYESP